MSDRPRYYVSFCLGLYDVRDSQAPNAAVVTSYPDYEQAKARAARLNAKVPA